MRYSSFNWVSRGKRGWIVGPFFGRTLTITWEWPSMLQHVCDYPHHPERCGWPGHRQTAQPCGEPMINVGNAHQHSCHVNGDHDIDEEENADVHVCECKFAWIIG